MKVRVLFVAAGMALALPLPALAGDRQQQNGLGHYEWRSAPQFGPRATGPARKRVWVAHNPKMPNCDCDMMKIVCRQNIWRRSRRRLAERGPRPGVDIKRRACGAASVGVRWSSV